MTRKEFLKIVLNKFKFIFFGILISILVYLIINNEKTILFLLILTIIIIFLLKLILNINNKIPKNIQPYVKAIKYIFDGLICSILYYIIITDLIIRNYDLLFFIAIILLCLTLYDLYKTGLNLYKDKLKEKK
jgi:hypothetical protein